MLADVLALLIETGNIDEDEANYIYSHMVYGYPSDSVGQAVETVKKIREKYKKSKEIK